MKMHNFDELDVKKQKPLLMIGSQVNFSQRAKQNLLTGSVNCRPHSAILSHIKHVETSKGLRPKSAETINLCFVNSSTTLNNHSRFSEQKFDGGSTILDYTDCSSRLLQDLLRNSNHVESEKVLSHDMDTSVNMPQKNKTETQSNEEHFISFDTSKEEAFPNLCPIVKKLENFKEESIEESFKRLKIQSWLPKKLEIEEKFVRFKGNSPNESENHSEKLFKDSADQIIQKDEVSDGQLFSRNQRKENEFVRCRSFQCNFESKLRSELKTSEIIHDRNPLKTDSSQKSQVCEIGKTTENLRISNLKNRSELPSFEKISEISQEEFGNEEAIGNICENEPKTNSVPQENLTVSIKPIAETNQKYESLRNIQHEKSDEAADIQTTKYSHSKVNSDDWTYEEIVHLLQTLEKEDETFCNEPECNGESLQMASSKVELGDHFHEVYSYLEKVEKEAGFIDDVKRDDVEKKTAKSFSSPRLEELLNKGSVELAHEVLSLKIQLEDQKKGIKLLRDTLTELKEKNKTVELDHQEALQKANSDAEALVQRHQKFIKKLLNEKKNLNETVSKLIQDLKAGEERHKRNVKALEEKHLVDVKRAKESQAAADKIKREKWMETKTQKIKEMTVKGLEPELSRMAARQQEELTELRNLHRAELEAVDMRAARRTSELMDQLRTELARDKENCIEKETAAVRKRMEEQFEDERARLQSQIQKLRGELRREEEKINDDKREFQQKLNECRKELEKERQKMLEDFQEKLEETERRYQVELKHVKDSLDKEKEVWMKNFKRQEEEKFSKKQSELHQQYKRDRDRDIELIIETLEKESAQAQAELTTTAENKLKKLKEKLENELKEAEANEALIKGKLFKAKAELLKKEETVTELYSQIRQSQTEINFLRKSCEQMTSERANLKEIIRKEFDKSFNEINKEKENLEREISLIKEVHVKELAKKDQLNQLAKNEMQKELAKIYSRIREAVAKKDKVIESLRQDNRTALQKCQQLESMLDRQRRNLLLQ